MAGGAMVVFGVTTRCWLGGTYCFPGGCIVVCNGFTVV